VKWYSDRYGFKELHTCGVAGFRRGVNQIFALLRCYSAKIGS